MINIVLKTIKGLFSGRTHSEDSIRRSVKNVLVAEKHIAKLHDIAEEMGGSDKEIKAIFSTLHDLVMEETSKIPTLVKNKEEFELVFKYITTSVIKGSCENVNLEKFPEEHQVQLKEICNRIVTAQRFVKKAVQNQGISLGFFLDFVLACLCVSGSFVAIRWIIGKPFSLNKQMSDMMMDKLQKKLEVWEENIRMQIDALKMSQGDIIEMFDDRLEQDGDHWANVIRKEFRWHWW